jgi:hypothetical protein
MTSRAAEQLGIQRALASLPAVYTLFILTGAILFALALTFILTLVMETYLPGGLIAPWAMATGAGGLGYWIVAWGLFFYPLNRIISVLSYWQFPSDSSEGDQLVMHLLVVLGMSGVGAVLGLASGAVLALCQWAVLRQAMENADWWPGVIIFSNTMLLVVVMDLGMAGSWAWGQGYF